MAKKGKKGKKERQPKPLVGKSIQKKIGLIRHSLELQSESNKIASESDDTDSSNESERPGRDKPDKDKDD